MRGQKDLRLVLAAAALCAVLAAVLPVDVLRLVFALPLVLYLPGYALAAAIFARERIEAPKMALLAAGLSLTVLPLGALLINYAPGGIGVGSWATLLFLVVLGACRAAAVRRPPARNPALALPKLGIGGARAAVLGLAALATVGALVLAFVPLSAKHAIGYTELWIKPSGHTAASIGVRSDEQKAGDYRLEVRIGSAPTPIVRRFSLDPGESRIVRVDGGADAGGRRVSADLFRSGHPASPYRRVATWIPAAGSAQ
jgi:uncharacterized membrane protein